jgi:hypothetical protein
MYLQKTRKSFKRAFAGSTAALLLCLPANFTHAQTAGDISFTVTSSGNWEYAPPFQEPRLFSTFMTSDGRGSVREGAEPFDTGIPTSITLEVLIADTPDGIFMNHCPTPRFTNDPEDDLSCFATAATDQGFAYVIGESTAIPIPPPPPAPPSPPARLPAPCVCPKT